METAAIDGSSPVFTVIWFSSILTLSIPSSMTKAFLLKLLKFKPVIVESLASPFKVIVQLTSWLPSFATIFNALSITMSLLVKSPRMTLPSVMVT